jgi:hypothetical protein
VALWLVAGFVMLTLLVHGGLTWRDYFQRWATAPDTFEAFEGDIAAAAGWVATHPAEEVFLSADIYRHPSFVFLHQQAPLSEFFDYVDPALHFFDGRTTLPLPPPGQEAIYLFTFNAGPDPLLERVLGWTGLAPMDAAQADMPELAVRRLNAGALDRSQFQPVDVAFQPGPRLIGYRLEMIEEDLAAVLLLWETGAPQPGWFQGLQVQAGWQPAGGGQQLAQASSELAYRPTEWAPGSQALSWLYVAIPPDLPSNVQLAVRVVNQVNGLPLAADGSDGDGWLSLPVP